jgi:hypothetical protein
MPGEGTASVATWQGEHGEMPIAVKKILVHVLVQGAAEGRGAATANAFYLYI